jgi:UPF0716 protein FxsA
MRSRGGWGLPVFVLLLVAVPIFEVWLLIQVGHQIGLLATVLILIGEALLGGRLMRREGRRAWKGLSDAFGTGRMPTGELADAALVLVGGVLLMLPGFATDVLGLLCLLPLTRPAARQILGFFIARRIQRLGVPLLVNRPASDPTVIEGETVEAETAEGPVHPRSETSPQARTIIGEVEDGRA